MPVVQMNVHATACDPANFPSLLCLRPSHRSREHQTSNEVSTRCCRSAVRIDPRVRDAREQYIDGLRKAGLPEE
jgi:hypothetical protein